MNSVNILSVSSKMSHSWLKPSRALFFFAYCYLARMHLLVMTYKLSPLLTGMYMWPGSAMAIRIISLTSKCVTIFAFGFF